MEICWECEADHYVLHWSRPLLYEEYVKNPLKLDDAYFYSISAQWNDHEERILYIGMTCRQDVLSRMEQHGIKRCKRKYPRKSKNLIISVAEIIEYPGSRITDEMVKDIEALLIYSSWNESMVNARNIYGYKGRLCKQIHIVNSGFTLLSDKVFWGVSSSA